MKNVFRETGCRSTRSQVLWKLYNSLQEEITGGNVKVDVDSCVGKKTQIVAWHPTRVIHGASNSFASSIPLVSLVLR